MKCNTILLTRNRLNGKNKIKNKKPKEIKGIDRKWLKEQLCRKIK